MDERFVVIDLETTGNSVKKGDRIIQIGLVVIENRQIVKRFSSFVNPECSIPPFIQQLTQIGEQMVRHAPLFSELAPTVAALLKQSYFVAHNVAFDWPFLQEELNRAGVFLPEPPMIDTVELSRILYPSMESYKLSDMAKALHIPHQHPHQADSDAEVTAQLWLALLDKLEALPVATLRQLCRLSRDMKSDVHSIMDAMLAQKITSLHDDQYSYYQGIALRKPSPLPQKIGECPVSFREWFTYTETLPFRDYEHRQGQWDMMEMVYEALDTSQHALIEAGTGIGKSLAYLIPSLYFARQYQKPVVISTYTLQLGQQLMERDIPLLQSIASFPFHVAQLKGKRNYLSLEKFVHFLHKPNKNYDEVLTKCQLLVWLTETETGDVDELQLSSGGQLLWTMLHMGEEKEEAEYDFFQRARQRASKADLIITNHAFLLQDLNSDKPLFPPYEQLIVDEAHHLEDVASQYFGQSVDYVAVRLLLTRIGNGHDEGSFFQLRKRLEQQDYFMYFQSVLSDIELECDEWFRMIRQYVLRKQTNSNAVRLRYRFHPSEEKGRHWNAIRELLWRLCHHTSELAEKAEQLKMLDPSLSSLSFFTDVTVLNDMIHGLRFLLEDTDSKVVRWMEADVKGAANATAIYAQPIELEEFFAERLFTRKKSVILTSATLTTDHSFAYAISQLGLEDFYPICRMIPSPFDYKRQAKIMIPSDLPSIVDVSLPEYAHAVAEQLLEIEKQVKEKILVLFTSYELLRMTAAIVKEKNEDETLVLLAQGIQGGNAAKLTKAFLQFDRAILFGTSSFWEGIDLPREQLSFIVMVRLPFAPPDDPVIEAKSERIRAKGGRPFYDLSLPQAIIRFKQGFGRLIRTATDSGVLFVLDRRLTTASYGKYFVGSLPPVSIYEAPLEQLLQSLKK
ncbi:ATP-dependent helicase DinG [Anoxybacillus sp. UARK-01]|uniref:ATP-dependent DNA helicase DinG n=1 Tax=Anoxybacillus sp. UARK-01 TaxID=1895648 RepID=UPI0009BC28B5|nr:ATP-dependent DNA helicase DinG [Anoxybacillus sp. UARK-01]OQM45188.1 ATP-dependent helicase DinG [Anoxybacillus sp. UARK-01]